MKLNRLSDRFHDLKIKYKLFLAYFFVTLLPVMGIGYFSYTTSASYLKGQSLDIIYQFQQNTISSIEKRMDGYIFLADTIYKNQRIQKLISDKYTDSYEEYDTVISFLEPVLQSLLSSTGKGIYVALIRYNNLKSEILQYDFENITGLYGLNSDNLKFGQFYHVINYERVKDQPWLKAIKGNAGDYIWKQVGKDIKNKYMSLLRETVDFADLSGEKTGLLRLTVRIADILDEENMSKASEKGFNLVFDKDNSLLSVDAEKSDFLRENEVVFQKFLGRQNLDKSLIVDDKIFVKGVILPAGWRIVSVFPITRITENMQEIRNTTAMYVAISFLFLLGVTFILSSSFSGRIISIAGQMQKFKKGDFDVRVKEVNKDELGFLASIFNDMTGRIKTLIQDNYQANIDRKDAQLRALQAQINPHFLYNSMSAISRLAEMGENEDIICMVQSLSRFYRLTLNKGRDTIRISDEIDQVKAYLEIFRIRKGEFFNISYRIDEAVLEYYTVKVILQPFVENIFEHALRIDGQLLNIVLSAEQKGDDIVFKIIDDGLGIAPHRLKELFSTEHVIDRSGYGIRNVDERIKLHFGKNYGVRIESVSGEGTTVTVTIPKDFGAQTT